MVLVTGLALLAVAAALLGVGAELFAEHAGAASHRLGVTALAVGLVLAGAEPEELVTAIFAAAQRHPGIAVGDAIGANVTMLTLVLGLAVLARPVRPTARVRAYALVASAAGVVAALAVLGGVIGRAVGAVLVAIYIVIVGLIWARERRPPAFGEAAELAEEAELAGEAGLAGKAELAERAGAPGQAARAGAREVAGEARKTSAASAREATRWRRSGAVAVLLMLAGLVLMVAGGRLAVAGAERITAALGLRESVVGLTLVALATTAELFALVWAAARRGVDELALAGVLGSAIYNSTATLGVAALVRPLAVAGMTGQAWLASALPAAFAAWAILAGRVGRLAGLLLIGCYAGFLIVTFA